MSFFSPAPPVTYRPLSLSVIGWYYAASGAFGLLLGWVPLVVISSGEVWHEAEISFVGFVVIGAVTSAVQFASGMAILKRLKWGRILLLASVPSAALVMALLSPFIVGFALATSALHFGVLAFFLTRPAASAYFDGSVTQMPEEIRAIRRLQRGERTQSDVARVFGVILAFPGWYILTTATAILVGVLVSSGPASESFFRTGFSTFVFSAQGVGIAILGVGTLLWGRRRWKAYLGWGLLAIGVNALTIAAFGAFPLDPTQFLPPDQEMSIDPERFMSTLRQAARAAAVAGALLLSIGGLMVAAQRRHDRDAAAFMDVEPTDQD